MRNLVVGVLFIIGGASGQMVLRGTQSSLLLIGLGIGLVIFGVVQMARGSEEPPEQPPPKIGEQVEVQQAAVVYTEMNSSAAPVANLRPGTKVTVIAVSTANDLLWLRVKLPDEREGYLLGYTVRP